MIVLTEINGVQNLLLWGDDTPYDEWCSAMVLAGHRYTLIPEMRKTDGSTEEAD